MGELSSPLRRTMTREELMDRLALYSYVAAWGGLCLLVMVGKFLRFRLRFLRSLAVPACLVGAVASLCAYSLLKLGVDSTGWDESWDRASTLLLNLVYASWFLSLQMPLSIPTIFHEALPQLLYAQVLGWGMYVVAIPVGALMEYIIPETPSSLALTVTTGLEGGWSSLLFADKVMFTHIPQFEKDARYADASAIIGVIIALVMGIILINNPHRKSKIPVMSEEGTQHVELAEFMPQTPEAPQVKKAYHSLGLHVGVVTFASTLAYIAVVLCILFDIGVMGHNGYLMSTIPLVSFLMVSCHIVTRVMHKYQKLRQLNRHMFHRICVMALELLVIVDVSNLDFSKFKVLNESPKITISFAVVLLSLLLWHVVCFTVIAPRLCPNHWYLRAVAEGGQGLGLTWTGLLFVRTMDPLMRTPVPFAFAAKQMVHNVILSGGLWSTHVLVLANRIGIWPTFGIALAVLLFWMLIHVFYFNPRLPFNTTEPTPQLTKKKSLSAVSLSRSPLVLGTPRPSRVELMVDSDLSEPLQSTSAQSNHKLSLSPLPPNLAVIPLPSLIGLKSHILDPTKIRCLVSALTFSHQTNTEWHLVYSLYHHGASLNTLYRQCASPPIGTPDQYCFVLVEDSWGYVFGAFLSELPRLSQLYRGNGECFVFSFCKDFSFWEASGANDFHVLGRPDCLLVGGPEPAFTLDRDLEAGASQICATYNNTERLASGKDFKAVHVEVWVMKS
eukprot:c32359_g1_i1.p1 GENE.c32359_g1_i1~~c32359_g1_i1.p1  ORF type:complete len:727 (+),score=135.38 c32359_g1_i1:1-2181(+)